MLNNTCINKNNTRVLQIKTNKCTKRNKHGTQHGVRNEIIRHANKEEKKNVTKKNKKWKNNMYNITTD